MKNLPARLLLFNRAWVANRLELKSSYFSRLSKGQTPQALWIGCSDSRAPAEEITGARPGELFVHRNIANLVEHADNSLDCVLYYSLCVLKVKHVIVCGHTVCGGVLAALQGISQPNLAKWLAPIRSLAPDLPPQEEGSPAPVIGSELWAEIVRANVRRGVRLLSAHPFMNQARQMGNPVHIHGWVYELNSGLIDPICEAPPEQPGTIVSQPETEMNFLLS